MIEVDSKLKPRVPYQWEREAFPQKKEDRLPEPDWAK